MEPELFSKLVSEVRETVATGISANKKGKRPFGVVDLWHIQKNRKYTGEFLRKR
jgi:hypothetical protein